MIRPAPLALSLVAALALAGCAKKKELNVTDAWVRFAPVPTNPSAAYFTVHGGDQDVSLIDVSTEVAIRSEMHETMGHGGAPTGSGGPMASMKPVTSVPIPAGSTVKFEPGGKHVMLYKINPGLKPPKTITLTFAFSNGERIQADAPLVAAGDAGPAGK
jgi:copper(I)-binding protein